MADADEDAIPTSSQHAAQAAGLDEAYDPEDEVTDYRFLTVLTSSDKKHAAALPRRGEKDFEPNPTKSQASHLQASREAMRDVLSVERVHFPNNTCVGQFLPDAQDWRHQEATSSYGTGARCVVVERFKGTQGRTVGVQDWRSWTWLLPEEALFLVERGTLELRWPDASVDAKSNAPGRGAAADEADSSVPDSSAENVLNKRKDEAEIADESVDKHHLHMGELPMSLQGAYASFIGKSGLTLERYIVYAHLKRLGYVVQRAPTWDDGVQEAGSPSDRFKVESSQIVPTTPVMIPGLINRLLSYLFEPGNEQYRPAIGPLIRPGIYRSYNDIFRTLSLVQYYNSGVHIPPHHQTSPTTSNSSSTSQLDSSRPTPPFNITFHVWKPSTTYAKSHPPHPDFRLCVLDARTTSLPSLTQLSALLDSVPADELPADRRMEARLKHGCRNVILAVVDAGLVSFLRWSDARFGDTGKLFETKAPGGTKGRRGAAGGGKRGGAGRGRGGRDASTTSTNTQSRGKG